MALPLMSHDITIRNRQGGIMPMLMDGAGRHNQLRRERPNAKQGSH